MKKFAPYEEAQSFAKKNNINSSSEWRRFDKPDIFPKYPENIYKKEWTSWGEFLGNGKIADNLKVYLNYSEAKDFLKTLHLKSSAEYFKWWKDASPSNLPRNAQQTYMRIGGWVSWSDFLTANKSEINILKMQQKWIPIEDLKVMLSNDKIKSKTEYRTWFLKNKKENIPSDPQSCYKRIGTWNGWNDLFGTEKKLGIQYMPYEQAKEYLKSFSFKSLKEYQNWKRNDKSISLPINPEQYYKKVGSWVSVSDFLTNNNTKKKQYVAYNEAKKIVSKFGLNTVHDYILWWVENKPLDLPRNPAKVYKNEWECWGIFLGSDVIRSKVENFVSYDEAKKIVNSAKINSADEFRTWIKENKITNIPLAPSNFYKEEWISWPAFLGNNVIHKWSEETLMPFNELKKIVKEHKIDSIKAYNDWYKETKLPGVPSLPQKHYKNEWVSWSDFLGTEYTSISEREFYSYEKCSAVVRSFNLKGKEDFCEFIKTCKDKKIPHAPDRTYRDSWITWGEFLGTFRVANKEIRNFKFNLLQEFEDEYAFREFLANNDINILQVILRNVEPKYEPLKKDIEKALANAESMNPIRALEEKYSSDNGGDEEPIDNEPTAREEPIQNTPDLDDDDAMSDFINTMSGNNEQEEKEEPTIEEITRNREEELKVINRIEHMLTPEDREYIMNKFLNDKRRDWMANREQNK